MRLKKIHLTKRLLNLSLVTAIISAGLLNIPQFIIYGTKHWELIILGSFGYGTPVLFLCSLVIYSQWENKVRKFSAGMLFGATLFAMGIANLYLFSIHALGGVEVHHRVAEELFPADQRQLWAHVQITIIGLSFPVMYLSMAAGLLRWVWPKPDR